MGRINEHYAEASSGGGTPMQWGEAQKRSPSAAMTEKNQNSGEKDAASPMALFSLGIMPTIKISTLSYN